MDIVTVTVRDITGPTADAGDDHTIDQHQRVTFNGSGSYDNIDIVNWTWTYQYNDIEVSLYGMSPSFTFDIAGDYVITLSVLDGAGNRADDTALVHVLDITPPMAMAGPDQEVDQFETVILDGTRSRDNVAITVFTWTIFTSTTEIVLDGSIARYAFEIPGVFGVELNVTDAAGNWAIDSLEVNVTDITPPVARVGEDITTGQGQIVTFDGSGSSDNVGIVNFSWSFDPQGKAETLFGMTPSFQFEPVGVFPVTLVVRDEAGNQATTVLLVTVTDTTDPVANAGDDLNITEGTLVHLDGSASVDNVGVVNWTWEFEYDDGIVTLFSPTSSFRFDIPGNYTVSLKVFDRVGNSGSDTMQILVNRIPGGGPDSGPGDDEGPDENDLCFLFLLIILVISAAMAWSLYKRNRGWIRKKPHEKAEKD